MIARKPQKFSLNSSESNSEQLHKESASSFSEKLEQKKTAADTATSILEELGVKKTPAKKTNKNNLLNVQRKSASIKKPFSRAEGMGQQSTEGFKNPKCRSKKNNSQTSRSV